jgi:hypothetical protein
MHTFCARARRSRRARANDDARMPRARARTAHQRPTTAHAIDTRRRRSPPGATCAIDGAGGHQLVEFHMVDTAEVSLAKRLQDEERAYTVRVRQPNGKTSGRMHAYVSVECLPWTSRISFASNFVLF